MVATAPEFPSTPLVAGLADTNETSETPWNEEVEQRSVTVGADLHGVRLDKAVVSMASEFSRAHLQSLIAQGHVRVDGRAVLLPAKRVQAGQSLEVELVPTQESLAYRPEAMALPIVYEDDDILVLDKPAGWVVHPAAGHWSGTVLNGLLAHHAKAGMLPRAGIVHRLDKDTSGVMVVGKTLESVTALVRAIAAREVHRRYLALAHGRVSDEPFSVEAPLARDPASRVKMAVVPGGKHARTDIECLATHDSVSALSCTLHTGRTHQIRVHLASRGHPLVGDLVYGGKQALGMTRQALHATELRFAQPISGVEMGFEAPLPPDMAS
ncbi:MAG: ribosomal large subunit pseudouridine synthase, partial [Rhizobacter sp.]|nr:ribosomal large subunit pseudouridine synthase [Rhizobacter sp.]